MHGRSKANDPTQYRIVAGEHDLRRSEGEFDLYAKHRIICYKTKVRLRDGQSICALKRADFSG